MSLKRLVETARDLGIVVEGLDRTDLEKEIDNATKAYSEGLTAPLEWIPFRVKIDVPIAVDCMRDIALVNPSAFTYKSKAAKQRARKATDGKQVIDEMDSAGLRALDAMAKAKPLEERLMAALPINVHVYIDDRALERVFPETYDSSGIPVGFGPLSVKVVSGAPIAVLDSMCGGITSGQVLKTVQNQLSKRWNDMLAADMDIATAYTAVCLQELSLFDDNGTCLSAAFKFRRIGHIFHVTWETGGESAVGAKRARDNSVQT